MNDTNPAIMLFKVIKGQRFWYRSKVHTQVPISEWYWTTFYLRLFLSYHGILVKLSLLIGVLLFIAGIQGELPNFRLWILHQKTIDITL